MASALGKTVSKLKTAYQSGSDESVGLGKELNERAKMNQIGSEARFPAKVAEPERPMGGGTMKVDRVNPNYKPTQIPDPIKSILAAPRLKKGTPKVLKTGLAVVHKGEAVLKKADADQMLDRGAAALSSSSSAPHSGKNPKRMNIERLDDGSFNITHQHEGQEPMQKDAKFSARNKKHLVRHVRQAYNVPESGEQTPEVV